MHLIVHIGPFKTGTTSIQRTLHANNALLSAQGIMPFHVGAKQILDLSVRYAKPEKVLKSNVAMILGDQDEALLHSEACWQQLEKTIKAASAPIGILSSEHFSELGKPEAFFHRLKGFTDKITVVSYVRDPVDLFLSGFQEEVKGKGSIVLARPVEKFRLRYRRFLTFSSAAVGRENLIVRNFDWRNLLNGDVVADFMGIVGRFHPVPDINPEKANESLPGAALAYLIKQEQLRNGVFDRADRQRLFKQMLKSPEVAALPRLRLDSISWEASIRTKNKPIVDWVNREFLKDQIQLRTEPDTTLDPKAKPRHEFRDKLSWIMSYLTPEAETLINETLAS